MATHLLRHAGGWLFVILFLATAASAAQNPTVHTPYGNVTGTVDQGIFTFKGIPFALPPIGSARWTDPVEITPWPDPSWDATKFRAGCMAPKRAFARADVMLAHTMSEDCLYLNVFSPNLSASAKLPVIVFFHGGYYTIGTSQAILYDAAVLAKTADTVIVTTNYRLGVLGALVANGVNGNFHLKDQRQALRWVQKCIVGFGGDPSAVTIAGESAGGMSVAAHLSSPPSWPFFHQAIMASNPISVPQALTHDEATSLGKTFAGKLGCSDLKCLRSADAKRVIEAQEASGFFPLPEKIFRTSVPWSPVVDPVELPTDPFTAITTGSFKKVPILMGSVANESVPFVYDFFTNRTMNIVEFYGLMTLTFGPITAIRERATYGSVPPQFAKDARPWATVVFTDYIFYCPLRYIGGKVTEHVPTYVYFFDIQSTFDPWFYDDTEPACRDVVCHFSDVPYYFPFFNAPADIPLPKPTPGETSLMSFIGTMWGNFAHTGTPNPLPNNVVFKPFDPKSNVLVNLSIPVGTMHGYRNELCDFWDQIGYNKYR